MALPENPITRKEAYLAKIAGQEVQIPDVPITREEAYLNEIAKNGGGGGGYVLPTATANRLGGVKIGSGINVEEDGTISASGGGGTTDYDALDNKPSINDTELSGNKTASDLGLQDELTFDDEPTDGSANPVKSGGVYSADEAIRKWTTAETKSVSGNPITLTDGSARKAEGLAVTCNPKQNLHGYDHPWAGGAGKNKYNSETKTVKQTLNASNGGITNNNNWEVSDYIPASDGDITLAWESQTNFYQAIFCAYDANKNFIANSGVVYTGYAYSHTFTAPSGTAFVRFSWAFIVSGTEYPRMNVRVSIGATDLGYSPYSNICPITGYTECVVDRDGKNLFNKNNCIRGYINSSTGAIVEDNANFLTDYTIALSQGQSICMSANANCNNMGISIFNIDGSFIRRLQTSNISKQSYTAETNCIVRCYFNYDGTQRSVDDWKTLCDTLKVMIEFNSNRSDYVPYSHDTATISFGQTVYGGSVDFKTGKVTVTHVVVDLGSINYDVENKSGYALFYSNLNPFANMANVGSGDEKADAYCSVMSVEKMLDVNRGDLEGLSIGPDSSRIRICSKSAYMGMTKEQFKTAMDGVHLCYELATPIELTLTPAELELLKGYNYTTTNGTTIALAYLPDSLLAEAEAYVDAKIPPAPSSDGTYVLTCTVIDGTPAYTWESAT